MKTLPSSLILVACMGVSSASAFAQTAASPPAAGSTPTNAPAANPNSNPNPNPNSSPISGQNNNPSANPPTSNGNLPISPTTPQMPPNVNTIAPGSTGSVATNGTSQVFGALDQSHKGYLNQADVASNQFLSGHFQQCDRNHDGMLSQDEVGSCLQQMPPGQ